MSSGTVVWGFFFFLLFLCLEGTSYTLETVESFLDAADGMKLNSFIAWLQRTWTRARNYVFFHRGLGPRPSSCEECPVWVSCAGLSFPDHSRPSSSIKKLFLGPQRFSS